MIEFFQDLCAPELFFLRYALGLALLIGPILGVIGTMVVTRRISGLAGASAHAALGGFGLALYLQRVWMLSWCTATVGTVAGALGAALTVGIISITAREREDTVIGAVWALGMSIGLLFLDRTPGYVDWQGYLFGNILLLSPADLGWTAVLGIVVLIAVLLFYPQLLALSFDNTFAELRGVRTRVIYLALLVFTALTIVLLIHVAGIMLAIALLTLPAAAAGCYTRHLWSMMVISTLLNWLFITVGIIASYVLRLPSGPAIVVFAGIVYVLSLGFCRIRKIKA